MLPPAPFAQRVPFPLTVKISKVSALFLTLKAISVLNAPWALTSNLAEADVPVPIPIFPLEPKITNLAVPPPTVFPVNADLAYVVIAKNPD